MSDSEAGDEDPLDDVFVDGDEIERTAIRDMLEPYLMVDSESGDLYPTDEFRDLDSKDMIVVTLAAQRAKEMRGLSESAKIGPSKISDLSGVKEGTVKPSVRDLADEGSIAHTDDGYTIRAPQLHQASNRILDEE